MPADGAAGPMEIIVAPLKVELRTELDHPEAPRTAGAVVRIRELSPVRTFRHHKIRAARSAARLPWERPLERPVEAERGAVVTRSRIEALIEVWMVEHIECFKA